MTRLRASALLGLVAAGALVAGAAPAAAEDVATYDARGGADEAGGDARTRALDAAFASAVTEAVAELAGAAARARQADIEREILRRARRFVASFQVKGQTSVGGRLELEVAVRVDRDKLRARLTELGVATRATPPPAPPVAAGKAKAALLLRVVGAGPTYATFGAAASLDTPGLHVVAAALDRAGFAVVPPPGAGPAPGDGGALPVDDDGARALAGSVKAQVAVVVGIRVGALGPVRGVPIAAAPSEAHLRVIDVATGAVLAQATIGAGAWGRGERVPLAAVDAAAAAISAAAWPEAGAPPARTPTVEGPAVTARQGVTVRIRGARAWPAAAALKAQLAGAPGVERVLYAGVGAEQVALAVIGSTASRIAGVVRTVPGVDARVAVDGGAVEVLLGGAR